MINQDTDSVRNEGAIVGQELALLDVSARALELSSLSAAAAGYALSSRSENTRRAYKADWAHFASWCLAMQLQALPATGTTVCLYLSAHAGILNVRTLHRRLATISSAHKAAGQRSPVAESNVKAVWSGIARRHAQPQRRKTPLVVESMRSVLDQLDDSAWGKRDRALLLLAWGGALRRSEVVSLRRADVSIEERGLVVTVRRSKTDQHGDGRQIGIPRGRIAQYCPVRSWEAWQSLRTPGSKWAFVPLRGEHLLGTGALTDKHVARLVKRVCAAAGLEGDYSGHSLRAGFATAAASAGASERAIMAQTGHKSLLIARGYIRPATLFEDNAAAVAAL